MSAQRRTAVEPIRESSEAEMRNCVVHIVGDGEGNSDDYEKPRWSTV